jgi:hypothetical protein
MILYFEELYYWKSNWANKSHKVINSKARLGEFYSHETCFPKMW